ncbi:MAG: ATP-binding protein [Muribaculaceae bacterium]|nr:ATP-binding protein [Muribaculaceae bacterium]
MEIISRDTYIRHIMRYIGKGMMIALTGQRRVGKSYILRQIAQELTEKDPDANVIYINKEKKKFADIRTDDDLTTYLEGKIDEDKDNYLLIDEVQDIEGFENTLRSLNADEECQIIVTGSNAKMLSSELSTYLGGRYIDIHIQSLSYREFLTFHKLEDSQENLEKYLSFGGLPHLYRLGLENNDMVWEYIHNIYNTIVLKDVVEREGLRNVTLFENIMSFISDNTGQLVSATSISKYLKSQKIDLTPITAINYLKSAGNAYIVNKVQRYDIHGKKLLETNDKYYFEDLGLRNSLVGSNRTKDIEKLMENAAYLHLKNLGYKTYVGTLPSGEIDFVAEKNGKTVYFQIAFMLSDENTIQREFGNLLAIKDNYPKYVITMDPISKPKDFDGITHISLRQMLMTNSF